MTAPNLAGDDRTVTVRIPISIRRRAGRKLVLAPDGTANTWAATPRRIDSALVKAIARAFRWRKLLETGVYVTVGEIAAAEKINPSYVSRVLRLTLLAPDIVGEILDGRQEPEVALATLLEPFPVAWREQQTSSIDAEKVRKLRKDGMGPAEIARKLGIGRASVYRLTGGVAEG